MSVSAKINSCEIYKFRDRASTAKISSNPRKYSFGQVQLLFKIKDIQGKIVKWSEAATAGVLGKQVYLKILQSSLENTCARVCFFLLFFARFQPATLLKKSLWHRCFPKIFAKFFRTFILWNTTGRLLLTIKENIELNKQKIV